MVGVGNDPLIYLDNQSTTRVDPRVLAAMLPLFSEAYGNPGSVTHSLGLEARERVDQARALVAQSLGADPSEIVFTSGATESNNLAIRGIAQRLADRGRHIISVTTEHKAVLDPLERLARQGFEVTLLAVEPNGGPEAGRIRAEQVAQAIRPDTILVSVMLANNETGVLQPVSEIGAVCREGRVALHCDAVQAVGKIPVDVRQLQVDLLSFSAHKIYGPKGIGGLYVRRGRGAPRLTPQMDGGGQEFGLRSGTLNVPGIVGLAEALAVCGREMDQEARQTAQLRDRLWERLQAGLGEIVLNGPPLDSGHRLPGNLNVCFGNVDGQALMLQVPSLALSSGSACTSANPEPSHVLRAMGLSEDQVRSSLRISVGRFNTQDEIDRAADWLTEAARRLRAMSVVL